MRDETKRKFERAVWMQRARVGAIIAVSSVVFAMMLAFVARDASVELVRVAGSVTRVAPMPATAGQPGYLVDVKLANGQVAEVLVNQISDPKVGDAVEITARRHATGRTTYSWK
jgi:hypothetical protein